MQIVEIEINKYAVYIDFELIQELDNLVSGDVCLFEETSSFSNQRYRNLPQVNEELVLKWWNDIGNKNMKKDLLCYFMHVCNEIPSSKIFPNFSKNGLEKILLLLNTFSRFEALEARRKVFDNLLGFR